VFDPSTDPLGSGYNVIQSKVAIGSGGLWGKGFLAGTQTQLKFIPEQWTDFIFCMIGEEFGFIGSVILLTLYIVIIYKLISNAYLTRSRFLSIACVGFASIILFHLVINVGMTIGLNAGYRYSSAADELWCFFAAFILSNARHRHERVQK
jgi:rod shape determining protein RodA